ncbi:MAG: porin family protein [Bacteroidales bacterium]|nr:porin family protein [Bacteroidales bacterium]
MKNIFKKAAIAAIVLTMSVAAHAQLKGDMAAGGNLVLGTGSSYTNIGIGAKFQYNVTDPIRLEGSFTYFLKKDYVTQWDFSVNGHYLFPVADQITVYPLAGLGVYGTKWSIDWGLGNTSASNTDVCVNLGGGVDFKLTDQLILNAELKYKIVNNWSRLMLSAGVAFRF